MCLGQENCEYPGQIGTGQGLVHVGVSVTPRMVQGGMEDGNERIPHTAGD